MDFYRVVSVLQILLSRMITSVGFKQSLLWLLLLINVLIWLPLSLATFATVGVGHDSQLFAPGIHALLREGNMPWALMTRLTEARVDIFSYPYFSIIYPFYWTLGLNGEFSYKQHLVLDISSVIFHMVLASYTFGLLLSKFGCRVTIAAFGGIAYAYSIHMKLWSAWIWAVSAYAWIPFCLLGVWEIIVAGRQQRGILYLGIGFGMTALATGVGLVYAFILCASVMFALWAMATSSMRRRVLDLRSIVLGGLLGAAVGAAHLLPVLYRMQDYIRWYSGGSLVGQFKPPYEGTIAPALAWPSDLLQFVAPTALEAGKNVGHLYVGAAVFVLSLILLTKASEWRRFAVVLWVVSVYFLLDAFGDATFVHRLSYELPLLGSIRYPLANVTIPVILLTLMGCIALEQLLKQFEAGAENAKSWLIGFCLAVIAITGGVYLLDAELFSTITGADIGYLFLLPALVSFVALVLWRLTSRKSWMAVLPVAIMFAYLPQNSLLIHPKVPDSTELYNQCDEFLELKSALTRWARNNTENTRMAVQLSDREIQGCLGDLKLSESLLQSVAGIAGWNVMQPYLSPRPYLEFKLFSRLSSPRALQSHSALLKAGISHILTQQDDTNPGQLASFLRERGRVGSFVLYEVKNWQLGQTVAGCLADRSGEFELVTSLGRRSIGLSPALKTKGISEVRCGESRRKSEELNAPVTRTLDGSDLHYELQTTRPLLFVSDRVLRDDWVVTVNGAVVQPELVDQYRMALVLEAGSHKIGIAHRPVDFRIGYWLSLFGLLVTGHLIIRERYSGIAMSRGISR